MEITITVTDIVQYNYCPRKVYFLKTLNLKIPARRKMEYGRKIHEQEMRKLERRKTVYGIPREKVERVEHNLHLEDPELNLTGTVDTVVILKDGTPVPVEAKYTDYPRLTWKLKKQLAAYAILLEKHYGKTVKQGIIYFPLQKKLLKVEITPIDKIAVKKDIQKIKMLVKSEKIPRKADKSKCKYCEARKFCI